MHDDQPSDEEDYDPGGMSQFSKLNAGTLLNSPVFAVTRVRLVDRAWPAKRMS
jgi:hypothetical protein